jgi:hypothetical protein
MNFFLFVIFFPVAAAVTSDTGVGDGRKVNQWQSVIDATTFLCTSISFLEKVVG